MTSTRRFPFLLALALLLLAGCSNEVEPASRGSWLELLEVELTPDALDVENLRDFESVIVEDDRLAFRFAGESTLRVGHVVAGNTRDGYLRRVLAVNALPDGSIEATTRDATLAEYFAVLRATFHYDPVRVDEPTEATDGLAVAPLGDCMDSQPCLLGGTPSFMGNPMDLLGCTGTDGFGLTPFVETDFRSMDVPIDLGIDIGWTGIEANPTMYLDLDGTVRAGAHISGNGRGQLECMADFMALAGGGQAPEIRLARVIVYGIPIELLASPVLNGEVTAMSDAGRFRYTAGVQLDAALELGLRDGDYHQVGPDVNVSSIAELTTERAGPVTATGTLAAGVSVRLQIGYRYKRSGFTINIGAAAIAELTGSVGVELTTDAGGCEWTSEFPWALEFTPSVELSLMVEDIGPTWTHEFEPITLAEGSLGSVSGTIDFCTTDPGSCTGSGSCFDDVLDNTVCEGRNGFRRCADAEQMQWCHCTASGWTECGGCRAITDMP